MGELFAGQVSIFISRFITLSTSAGPLIWFALLAADFRDFLVFGFDLFFRFFPPLMGGSHFSPVVPSQKMKWKMSRNWSV